MSEAPETPPGIWGRRPIPGNGETQRVDVGPLTVWLRGVENELWVCHERAPEDATPRPELPDEPHWSRWALPRELGHLHLSPVFPDRPVVVKPEHPFTLLRRASARIYLRIPVWVRLEAEAGPAGSRLLLAEIPSVHLSDTWWGDFLEGELAFWLVTKGRRQVTEELFQPHLVICAVQLDNRSDDDLRVEKVAFRVEHLSIYERDRLLWAEEVRVEYMGDDEGSVIHMDDEPPPEAGDVREISPARHQARSFKARTFARLRALTPWGG